MLLKIALITLLSFHGRRVWVYTPADYDPRQTYDLLVAFDGTQYLDDIKLPAILDSLHLHTVAVLIDNYDGAQRTAELGNSAHFNNLLADSLIPWIRTKYNVTRDPHHTYIMGTSAGGLGASSAAFAHPEVFGNVLTQSGAYWRGREGSGAPPEWLTQQYSNAAKKDIRFVMEVGTAELPDRMLGPNRRFHDALVKKGYDVVYTEVAGGVHAPQTWGPRTAPALRALWRR